MKKVYVRPTVKSISIETSSIICSSIGYGGEGGGQRANAMSTDIFDSEYDY